MLCQNFSMVCRVDVETPNGPGTANGVFLGPRHVLTNYHVIEHAGHEISVTTESGRIGWSMPDGYGSPVSFNKGLDLAIIELDRKMTDVWACLPGERLSIEDAFSEAACILKTFKGGQPSSHAVEMPVWSGRPDLPKYTDFRTSLLPMHGHSGSPVFAGDGRTLLSLLSIVHTEELRFARLMRSLVSYPNPDKPSHITLPFMGPRPDLVERWCRGVMQP